MLVGAALGELEGGDGPMSPESYKRALYRPPPTRFTIEMLTPVKQGGNYSYGMMITPITRGDRSSIGSNSSSGSSSGSSDYSQALSDSFFSATGSVKTNMSSSTSAPATSPYEIWRRWEDFLFFQDMLELEYSRMARQKKARLVAGKGVKKNGMYLQDQASSFESLPPGPTPDSVKASIHDPQVGIPKLTKKGTMFRASDKTIQQRNDEIKAMVMGLFSDSVPALVAELRDDRKVVDFFGYWRRDFDLALAKKKAAEGITKNGRWRDSTTSFGSVKYGFERHGMRDRGSVTSSIFSTYFSPSVAESINQGKTSPLHKQVLPEDDEVSHSSPPPSPLSSPSRRNNHRHMSIIGPSRGDDSPPTTPTTLRHNVRESWQTTASVSTYLENLGFDMDGSPGSRMSMASFMTDCSADAVIGPFSAPPTESSTLPSFEEEGRRTRTELRRSLSTGSRRRVSIVSTSSSEGWSEDDDNESRYSALYDDFPVPSFHLPASLQQSRNSLSMMSARSETPTQMSSTATPTLTSYYSGGSSEGSESEPRTPVAGPVSLPLGVDFEKDTELEFSLAAPSSPTCDSFHMDSPVAVPIMAELQAQAMVMPTSVTIKAIHATPTGPSIVLLRVPTTIAIGDLRERIMQKFASMNVDEDVSGDRLTEGFYLGVVLPSPSVAIRASLVAPVNVNVEGKRRLLGRKRSSSLSAVPPAPVVAAKPTNTGVMRIVASQVDWERAVEFFEPGAGKMTVHVLDCVSA